MREHIRPFVTSSVGEQQPEVEHNFVGENIDSGLRDGRRWRHSGWFQYTLSTRAERAVNLVVTYWGGDAGRTFDILANDELLVTEKLDDSRPGQFFVKWYSVPVKVLSGAATGRINMKFSIKPGRRTGADYDLRLMKPHGPTTQ